MRYHAGTLLRTKDESVQPFSRMGCKKCTHRLPEQADQQQRKADDGRQIHAEVGIADRLDEDGIQRQQSTQCNQNPPHLNAFPLSFIHELDEYAVLFVAFMLFVHILFSTQRIKAQKLACFLAFRQHKRRMKLSLRPS